MEGARKTPERTPVNDGDEGNDGSSPIKALRPSAATHNAEEVAERTMPTALQEVSVKQMYELLGTTMEDMNKAFPELPRMPPPSKSVFDENTVTEYLDGLSDIVHKYLGRSTSATVINKLTRQTGRRALGSYPFLQPQSQRSEGSPDRHNQSS
jgi:hypothetical protein